MTDRERAFADLGIGYAEGIEHADAVVIPATGREARRTTRGTWESQPGGDRADNYWVEFADVLDAIRHGVTGETPRS